MYEIITSSKFRRDIKRCKRQKKDLEKFKFINIYLSSNTQLPQQFHDHQLMGKWNGYRECHIEPDWLLIYKINSSENDIMQKPQTTCTLFSVIIFTFLIQTIVLVFTFPQSIEMKLFGLLFVGLSSPVYGYAVYRHLIQK